MPRIYAKVLRGTVKEMVEAALNSPMTEQLSALEELAVVRASAADVVKLWSAAQGTQNDTLKTDAGAIMRDVLAQVVTLAEKASKIEAGAKDNVSVHTLHHVINQIVRIAHECFGDDPRVSKFQKLIESHVRTPVENTGTLLTPDQDVTDMDGSIPK